jgi:hypothetical protein
MQNLKEVTENGKNFIYKSMRFGGMPPVELLKESYKNSLKRLAQQPPSGGPDLSNKRQKGQAVHMDAVFILILDFLTNYYNICSK